MISENHAKFRISPTRVVVGPNIVVFRPPNARSMLRGKNSYASAQATLFSKICVFSDFRVFRNPGVLQKWVVFGTLPQRALRSAAVEAERALRTKFDKKLVFQIMFLRNGNYREGVATEANLHLLTPVDRPLLMLALDNHKS